MKPFKTVYVTFYQEKIIFPKEVQYLDDGYYLCIDQMDKKYLVTNKSIGKLSQDNFNSFIRAVHSSLYKGYPNMFVLTNIDENMVFYISIYPNGYMKCVDLNCTCTLYVPSNCTKWEYSLLKGYFNDSYILLPCDKNGKIIERDRYPVNPYTRNCNIVYEAILANPEISTSELIDFLGWPPNSVTSRISELTSGGRIYSAGRVLNPKSGRKVHKWIAIENMGY